MVVELKTDLRATIAESPQSSASVSEPLPVQPASSDRRYWQFAIELSEAVRRLDLNSAEQILRVAAQERIDLSGIAVGDKIDKVVSEDISKMFFFLRHGRVAEADAAKLHDAFEGKNLAQALSVLETQEDIPAFVWTYQKQHQKELKTVSEKIRDSFSGESQDILLGVVQGDRQLTSLGRARLLATQRVGSIEDVIQGQTAEDRKELLSAYKEKYGENFFATLAKTFPPEEARHLKRIYERGELLPSDRLWAVIRSGDIDGVKEVIGNSSPEEIKSWETDYRRIAQTTPAEDVASCFSGRTRALAEQLLLSGGQTPLAQVEVLDSVRVYDRERVARWFLDQFTSDGIEADKNIQAARVLVEHVSGQNRAMTTEEQEQFRTHLLDGGRQLDSYVGTKDIVAGVAGDIAAIVASTLTRSWRGDALGSPLRLIQNAASGAAGYVPTYQAINGVSLAPSEVGFEALSGAAMGSVSAVSSVLGRRSAQLFGGAVFGAENYAKNLISLRGARVLDSAIREGITNAPLGVVTESRARVRQALNLEPNTPSSEQLESHPLASVGLGVLGGMVLGGGGTAAGELVGHIAPRVIEHASAFGIRLARFYNPKLTEVISLMPDASVGVGHKPLGNLQRALELKDPMLRTLSVTSTPLGQVFIPAPKTLRESAAVWQAAGIDTPSLLPRAFSKADRADPKAICAAFARQEFPIANDLELMARDLTELLPAYAHVPPAVSTSLRQYSDAILSMGRDIERHSGASAAAGTRSWAVSEFDKALASGSLRVENAVREVGNILFGQGPDAISSSVPVAEKRLAEALKTIGTYGGEFDRIVESLGKNAPIPQQGNYDFLRRVLGESYGADAVYRQEAKALVQKFRELSTRTGS